MGFRNLLLSGFRSTTQGRRGESDIDPCEEDKQGLLSAYETKIEDVGSHSRHSISGRRRCKGPFSRCCRIVSFIVACLLVVPLLVFLFRPRSILYKAVHDLFSNPELRDLPCTTWPVELNRNMAYEFQNGTSLRSPTIDQAPLGNSTYMSDGFEKPNHFRVVAVVFFGRREYVDILDCYLRRNLVSNGGLLDEVQFLPNTKILADLDYLDDLVSQEELYSIRPVSDSCRGVKSKYDCLWDDTTDEDTLYLKIDDDVVYIHEDAIPRMVQARLEEPDAFAIGANEIGSHIMAWVHFHAGAVFPYLPEPAHDGYAERKVTWRASQLPAYPEDDIPAESLFDFVLGVPDPPYNGHRWLPLDQNSSHILETPIHKIEFADLDIATKNWQLGAQQHYSLLENIEKGQLDKYFVGSEEGIWHPQYRRYNLNFAAVWGSDIAANLPMPEDDEEAITVTFPKKLGRPFLVASRALISHLHFGPQSEGIRQTDLLDRYRALANEVACPADKQRMPFPAGDRCGAGSRPG